MNGRIDPKGRLSKKMDTARDLTPPGSFPIDKMFSSDKRTFKESDDLQVKVYEILHKDHKYCCIADYKKTKVLVLQNHVLGKIKLRRGQTLGVVCTGETVNFLYNTNWVLYTFKIYSTI